jgi:hypothetical protein
MAERRPETTIAIARVITECDVRDHQKLKFCDIGRWAVVTVGYIELFDGYDTATKHASSLNRTPA